MRKLVLWGHHLDDYREMFDLDETDLQGRLLEYACGPSAVNASLHAKGLNAVSCDPLFTLEKASLQSKVSLIFEDMRHDVERHAVSFDFSQEGGLDAFIAHRRQGMASFFADYERGCAEKRYVAAKAMSLPFDHFAFDLALCSHYLFADLEHQDVDFHVQILLELARVAKEVRVFPLIDCDGAPSALLGPVLLGLQQQHCGVELREVKYHLQTKGNAMLRVWAQQCDLSCPLPGTIAK